MPIHMHGTDLGRVCKNGHGALALAGGRGPSARRAPLTLALALVAALAAHPAAAERADGARVLWLAGGRLYVAVADSGALAPRMLVRVFDRDREVGRGQVERVLDGVVASVRLDGELDPRVRPDRLDRLDVVLEPAPARVVAALRIGLPAPSRRALVPPCDDAWLDKSALPRAYLDEPLGADAMRLVADTSAAPGGAASAWPETLFVRFFADRADEEIALERGELDAAVFWPGEPSARLRDRASGFELLRGLRARGALVASGMPDGAGPRALVTAELRSLDAGLFAGDLLLVPATPDTALTASGRSRWRVDPALPGARAIERFLDRGSPSGPATVRLTWSDGSLPPDAADPPALLVRCPVLCSAARADDVRALGADRFASLVGCRTNGAGR